MLGGGALAILTLIALLVTLPRAAEGSQEFNTETASVHDAVPLTKRPSTELIRQGVSFAGKTALLTFVYAAIFLVLYASVKAQQSATGTFKINYEYRVF
jgi:hypothetical protein